MNPKDRAGAKKPNLSVLPFAPLLDVIPALYEGRLKYGPWNWRHEAVSETIYADAAIRHLMQFIAGEDIDPDSGVHHISKAIAGLLVVRDAQIHGCSVDDRFVKQDLQIDKQVEQLAGVNERYPAPVKNPCAEIVTRELPSRPPRDPYDVSLAVGETVLAHGEKCPEPVEFDFDQTICGRSCVPEDQGITGGETLTHEEAEKIAEYLFGGLYVGDEITESDMDNTQAYEDQIGKQVRFELKDQKSGLSINTDGSLTSWSLTHAGGGSYRIKATDVGKRVLLRDGREAKIDHFRKEYSGWPVVLYGDYQDFVGSVTTYGQYSEGIRDEDGYEDILSTDRDVVKVFHS